MCSVKVGFLVSYDYNFLKISVPQVYDFVDEIYFAVDKDRKTWSGQQLDIDDSFWTWLKEFDVKGKIILYEDSFFQPGLSPIACDTRERNMLGKQMGTADWYLQIDADEYFVDFEAFIQQLKSFETTKPTTITCRVVTLFKQLNTGYLLIGDSVERLCFATNHPVYDMARNNDSGNVYCSWDHLVVHQSWARTPAEIYQKLTNWSHKDDFNTTSFYKLWDAIDEFNYYALKNFHPLDPITWPALKFIEGSIAEILASDQLKTLSSPPKKAAQKPLYSRLWKEIKN